MRRLIAVGRREGRDDMTITAEPMAPGFDAGPYPDASAFIDWHDPENTPQGTAPGDPPRHVTIIDPLAQCGDYSDPVEALGGQVVRCTLGYHDDDTPHRHESPDPEAPSISWDRTNGTAGPTDLMIAMRDLLHHHGDVAVAVAFYTATGFDLLADPPTEGTAT